MKIQTGTSFRKHWNQYTATITGDINDIFVEFVKRK